MKFKSNLITQASGSIGGSTFSRNRGGMYIRSRSVPTNPNSTFQQAVRAIVSDLTSRWLNTLTATQRADWDVYAGNVLMQDRLGEPRNIGGLGHYVRSNTALIQAGGTRVDDAPTTFNLGDFTSPVLAAPSASGGTVDLAFETTDDWANEDDAVMLVYLSRGQNPSVNYFKGPYRYAGKIEGDSVSPPTSPATITMPFTVAAGQKVFAQIVVIRADGRRAATFRTVNTAV